MSAVRLIGRSDTLATQLFEVRRAVVDDAGAPVAPRLGLKLVATTLVSAILFAGLYAYAAYEG